MATSELPPIPPFIAELTGPLFLGHLFNWALFGALSVQVYIYYIAFPKDRPLPKAIVAFVYILEIFQTGLSTRDSFRNFGTGWGNMIDLDEVGWLWFSVPLLGSVICCTGQLFYAWRIWILSRQPIVTVIVVLIAMVQVSVGIYAGIKAHLIGHFSELQSQTFRTTAVWLGSAALDDIIIACCMTYYLHKSNTGFRSTSTLITKFVRLTVETGAVCAAFAIFDLAFYIAFQKNNYHLAPSIPLSKFYANSLLVVLNARVRFMGGRDDDGTTGPSGSLSYMSGTTVANKSGRGISVSVSQERYGDQTVRIPMDDISTKASKYSADRTVDASSTDDMTDKNAPLV